MSRHFGAIRQLGYVVQDIEAAMDYWSKTLGVGPWFYNPKVPIKNYVYRGTSYEPHNSVALANSGYVQVELIHKMLREDGCSSAAVEESIALGRLKLLRHKLEQCGLASTVRSQDANPRADRHRERDFAE